jgi:phage recombination protein Bet
MSAIAKLNTKQSLISKFGDRFGVDETEVKNLLKNTAFKVKDGTVTDEQMSALMIIANEYNLNPFTREIYAYPDKGGIVPVVGVDGWTRIMNEHPQFDGVEFKFSDDVVTHKGKNCNVWIECIITRKDRTKPIVVREYFDEVVRTPSFPTPWDSHPKRMHRHKTLIQCVRMAFGFCGIYDEDEAERILEKDVTAEGSHEPVKTQVKEVVYYTDDEFTQNENAWKKVIDNGKEPVQFIAFIESRGKLFTQNQKDEILLWKKKEPVTVDGQATQVDDPFVTEMNNAEKKK